MASSSSSFVLLLFWCVRAPFPSLLCVFPLFTLVAKGCSCPLVGHDIQRLRGAKRTCIMKQTQLKITRNRKPQDRKWAFLRPRLSSCCFGVCVLHSLSYCDCFLSVHCGFQRLWLSSYGPWHPTPCLSRADPSDLWCAGHPACPFLSRVRIGTGVFLLSLSRFSLPTTCLRPRDRCHGYHDLLGMCGGARRR